MNRSHIVLTQTPSWNGTDDTRSMIERDITDPPSGICRYPNGDCFTIDMISFTLSGQTTLMRHATNDWIKKYSITVSNLNPFKEHDVAIVSIPQKEFHIRVSKKKAPKPIEKYRPPTPPIEVLAEINALRRSPVQTNLPSPPSNTSEEIQASPQSTSPKPSKEKTPDQLEKGDDNAQPKTPSPIVPNLQIDQQRERRSWIAEKCRAFLSLLGIRKRD